MIRLVPLFDRVKQPNGVRFSSLVLVSLSVCLCA